MLTRKLEPKTLHS